MGKKVTMQDIADAMGITRNTVSKAFHNLDGIAPGTREKILQKAEEMGYKPFACASPLTGGMKQRSSRESSGYQGEIALLTGSYLGHDHFALPMLDAFQAEIAKQGYTMNTHRVTDADIAALSLPAMTSFAVQLLFSRIKTPSLDYRTVYAETELIYRESAK